MSVRAIISERGSIRGFVSGVLAEQNESHVKARIEHGKGLFNRFGLGTDEEWAWIDALDLARGDPLELSKAVADFVVASAALVRFLEEGGADEPAEYHGRRLKLVERVNRSFEVAHFWLNTAHKSALRVEMGSRGPRPDVKAGSGDA